MKATKVYILISLCVLFWSGNFIIGKFIHTEIEAIELAFFRWSFTLLFILPTLFFIDIKRILNVYKKNIFIITLLAFLGITLFNTIVYTALKSTSATNALLINSSTPLIILLLSSLIFKNFISKLQILGIVISTIGVVFLVLKGDFLNILDLSYHAGDFWIIISSFCWALYSVLVKLKPKELNFYEFFILIVFIGFILLLPLYLYQNYSIEQEIKQVKNFWYFFIYISFFTSILSYYFWNIGIEEIGASKTGQFTHLMPIFGSILAFVFLKESLELYHILGATLIAFGIYLSLFIKKATK